LNQIFLNFLNHPKYNSIFKVKILLFLYYLKNVLYNSLALLTGSVHLRVLSGHFYFIIN
jgi:hypothetical protein